MAAPDSSSRKTTTLRQTLSRGVFAAAAAATGILSLYGTPALADSFAGGGAEDSPGVLSGNNVQAPVHVPVNACGNTVTAVGALNEASDNTCVNSESGDKHGDGAHAVGGTKGSPGVISGNNVQAPIDAPVNACGNSVNGAAALNGAYDNTCANLSDDGSGHDSAKSADRSADSSYTEATSGSSHTDSGDAHAVGAAKGSPGVLSGNVVQAPIDLSLNACGNSVNLVGLFNDASGNTCVNETGYEEEEDKEKDKEKPEPPTKVKTPPTPVEEPPAEEVPGNPPHMAQTGTDGMMAASAAGAVLITGGAMLYRRGRLARR